MGLMLLNLLMAYKKVEIYQFKTALAIKAKCIQFNSLTSDSVKAESYRPDVFIGCSQQLNNQVDLLDLRGSRQQRFVGKQLSQDTAHCPVKETPRLDLISWRILMGYEAFSLWRRIY